MSRALWFVAGAGAGVYGLVRGRRAAESFTADGLRDRVDALTWAPGSFATRSPRARPSGKPSCVNGSAYCLMDDQS